MLNLTKTQEDAVKSFGQPILVIASAGSGKTRIIVEKLFYLLQLGVPSDTIVILTFTNKAANEIIERVSKKYSFNFPYISTFHSFCLKLLKEYYDMFGINNNFSIIDDDEQIEVIKNIINNKNFLNKIENFNKQRIILDGEEIDINDKKFPYKVTDKINFIKLDKIKFDNDKIIFTKLEKEDEILKIIFEEYQNFLNINNFFDFQDLLIYVLKGLQKSNISEFFKNKFNYIMVDEFQDTNWIQMELLKYISSSNNLLAVGDEDQAIYSFRGGTIENILNFEKVFPNTKLIFMTENFRSGKNILNFANFIISTNKERRDKSLIPTTNIDSKVSIIKCFNIEEQAQAIVSILKSLIDEKEDLNQIAILYRANWQSANIEELLLENKINYQIFGSISFFKRKEIKVAFDFISFLTNQNSFYLFSKLINLNRIRIGEKTIEKFENYLKKNNYQKEESLINYILKYENKKDIRNFGYKIIELTNYTNDPEFFLQKLYEIMDLKTFFEKIRYDEIDSEEREENYNQLILLAKDFKKKFQNATIFDFYNNYILYTRESYNNKDGVKLLTIHLAKGLEFKIVFICGLTEGLLPYVRIKNPEATNLEEERRLFYVAITRAKEKLYIFTHKYIPPYLYNKDLLFTLITKFPNYGKISSFLNSVENLNFVNFYSYDNFNNKIVKIDKEDFINDGIDSNYYNINSYNNEFYKEKKENINQTDNNDKNELQNLNEGDIFINKRYGKLIIKEIIKISNNLIIYKCIDQNGNEIKIIKN